MGDEMFECTSRYEKVTVVTKVKVKIPGARCLEENPQTGMTAMQEVPGMNMQMSQKDGEVVFIERHFCYRDKQGGVYLTRNFFVKRASLGKSITAQVTVVKKTLEDGREYLLLDVIEMPDERPTTELKLVDDRFSDEDIQILGSTKLIRFKPCKVRTPKADTTDVKVRHAPKAKRAGGCG